MKCFRSVHLEFGNLKDIFKGVGAAEYPGRWNEFEMPCIYSSSTIEAAAAERAYHSLVPKIESYNEQIRKNRKGFPAAYFEEIRKANFKLAEVELVNITPLDLTTQTQFSQALQKASFPSKTLMEARKSTYALDAPPFWTRKLASFFEAEGAHGLIVRSARSDKGNTVALFERNISIANFEIKDVHDFELAALPIVGPSPLKKGSLADITRVEFRSKVSSGITDILFL